MVAQDICSDHRPCVQIHHKKQSNKDNIKKRRGSRRLDDDIVDPAQPGPVAATLLAKQGHGHPGRRASGTTRSPPESLDVSKSPPRSGYRTMRTGTTPPRTTNDDTTIRRAKRRGAGGGSGGKTRCSAAGVGLTAPPPGKTAVPLTIEELVRGTLTEEEIRVAAGRSTTRELQDVAKLALVIDSSEVSVEGVWDSLPKLHTLNLTGSRLLSFRDLGVGLRHLNTLYLESSCVQDLDGIGALSGLRELHLADNRISDATPLACHGSLQILSLERNRVSDMNALEILSSIPLLYSLNLRNNPLMDSLGKLRDGRGRHVVHQLIPQIRVLDGTHLSSGEGGPIDAQTLDEAGDLICQGASRARAAWAEEEETTATAAATGTAGGNGWRHRGGGGGGGGGGAVSAEVGGSSFSRRATRPNVRVAEAEAEANDVQPPPPSRPEHAETIHWDSDLTQGGRQALSGNPSSAIRRHKSGRGAGKGGNGHSPTRVLETLDLAKIMELGLKHRHNTQQSAERVSEWRRETCSDSVPEEDPCTARLGAAVPLSRLDAIPLSTSALEGCFDRRVGRGTCEGEGSPARTTATWASSSASAACGSAEVAAVDGDARQLLLVGAVGRRNSSGRPWTTGGFVGGGRATTTVAAAAISGSDRARTDHPRRQAPAQKNETAAEEQGHRGGQETRPHPRRRRPQTAKEPAGKRCGVPGFDDSNASWQPVWESLRTARLISSSSPRTTGKTTATAAVTERAEKGVVAGRASPLGGADGAVDKKPGSVDFGRQRRARTTARAARGGDYDYLNDSDCEAPEEDVGSSGSDDSEEAGDRALIKRRASELASKASGVVDGISCPAPAAVPPPPCSPLAPDGAPEGLTASTDNHKVAHHAAPHKLVASVESQRAHGRPKARQREKASLALRRSLAVMDDDTCSSSSSDDDEARRVLKRSEPPAPGGKLEERPGVGQSKIGNGLGGAGGVAGGGGSPGGRGSTSSPRREPSAHASRLLGFDLKKSLAAIDEWTDKAGTTARNSGSNSGSKGGTPREGAAKALGVHQQAPFIIGHTATVGGMSPLSSSSSQTLSEVAGREVGDRGLRGGKAGGVPVAKRPTPSIQQNKHGSPARAGNHNTADTDDDEYDDGEAVLSVAAARAALGISKAATAVDTAGAAPCGRSARGAPSLAEIDAITAIEGNDLKGRAGAPPAAIEGRRKQRNTGCGGNSRSSSGKNSRGAEGGRSARTTSTGMAVSMSDEDLKNMLKQQPRMVPELRTKESFREFFRGMEAARMSRLLRGAYEGNLPADQVDKKVKKRLGLVGDRLAW